MPFLVRRRTGHSLKLLALVEIRLTENTTQCYAFTTIRDLNKQRRGYAASRRPCLAPRQTCSRAPTVRASTRWTRSVWHELESARWLSRDRFCQSVKNRLKGVTTSQLQSALSPRLWIAYRVNRAALDSEKGPGCEAGVKWTGTRQLATVATDARRTDQPVGAQAGRITGVQPKPQALGGRG